MIESNPVWCVMPIAGAEQYTDQAIADCLGQSIPTRVLLISQGLPTPFLQHLERLVEGEPDRLYLWDHDPPLPSLSATWNRALRFVWECGGTEALVVNNDTRLDPCTVQVLRTVRTREQALFVSAVGVTQTQFEQTSFQYALSAPYDTKGGPDFSCFLISKACHEQYQFDEGFIPAFAEDLDYHRRLMLAGDGDKIFSVNLPYLHYASQTLKTMDPVRREQIERQINTISRAYYEKKWGGPVNGERWTIPFDQDTDQDGVTTPDLQRSVQHGG